MNGRWPGIGIARSAGEPWTPLDLASLSLFLDGSDASTFTVVADNRVSRWRDKSPGARDIIQLNGSFQPVLASQGISQGRLIKTDDAVAQNTGIAHFFLCYVPSAKPPGGGNDGTAYYSTWPPGADGWKFDQLFGHGYSSNELLYQPSNNNADATAAFAAAGTNKIEMFAGYWDASSGTANVQMWRNSTLQPTTITGTFPLQSFAGQRTLAVGDYLSTAPAGWNLPVPLNCIITCYPVDMIANREKIEGWAAHAFGQTALLPANHPYKNSPPMK